IKISFANNSGDGQRGTGIHADGTEGSGRLSSQDDVSSPSVVPSRVEQGPHVVETGTVQVQILGNRQTVPLQLERAAAIDRRLGIGPQRVGGVSNQDAVVDRGRAAVAVVLSKNDGTLADFDQAAAKALVADGSTERQHSADIRAHGRVGGHGNIAGPAVGAGY